MAKKHLCVCDGCGAHSTPGDDWVRPGDWLGITISNPRISDEVEARIVLLGDGDAARLRWLRCSDVHLDLCPACTEDVYLGGSFLPDLATRLADTVTNEACDEYVEEEEARAAAQRDREALEA